MQLLDSCCAVIMNKEGQFFRENERSVVGSSSPAHLKSMARFPWVWGGQKCTSVPSRMFQSNTSGRGSVLPFLFSFFCSYFPLSYRNGCNTIKNCKTHPMRCLCDCCEPRCGQQPPWGRSPSFGEREWWGSPTGLGQKSKALGAWGTLASCPGRRAQAGHTVWEDFMFFSLT